jgi:hypothetical protein
LWVEFLFNVKILHASPHGTYPWSKVLVKVDCGARSHGTFKSKSESNILWEFVKKLDFLVGVSVLCQFSKCQPHKRRLKKIERKEGKIGTRALEKWG